MIDQGLLDYPERGPYEGGLAEDTTAVILAGGRGTRLGPLTRYECKPALPFGGFYRNIDFSLSNCVNSGIEVVGVPTQYRDASLLRHLRQSWRAGSTTSPVRIDAWRAAALESGGYLGTADAVYQNWLAIHGEHRRLVLVLAGDHVYRMDYRPLLARHVATGADATVACIEVPIAEASQFGVMTVDGDGRIVRFTEKPEHPEPLPDRPGRALGSMGIYVFDRDLLADLLLADADAPSSTHDFGRDLIPSLVDAGRLMAYPFTGSAEVGAGYWRDVGTIAAYWRAHMELLDGIPDVDLGDASWPVLPFGGPGLNGRASSWARARRHGVLIADDRDLRGVNLQRSVVFGGVHLEPRAELENAVVLPGASIGAGCRLSNVIVDSGVHVPAGTSIGPGPHRFGIVEPLVLTADTDYAALRRPMKVDGDRARVLGA